MYLLSLEEMILWNVACMLFGVLGGFAAAIIGFRKYSRRDDKCTTQE